MPVAGTTDTLVGWRSEYGEERGTIHLWHTSHALLFLAHYECFLKRKIAADGIEAAGLGVSSPKQINNYWATSDPLTGPLSAAGSYAVFAPEPRVPRPAQERWNPESLLGVVVWPPWDREDDRSGADGR